MTEGLPIHVVLIAPVEVISQYEVYTLLSDSFFFFSPRQGFFVDLEPVLELALVDQAGLELQRSACLRLLSAGIKGVRRHHHPTDFF